MNDTTRAVGHFPRALWLVLAASLALKLALVFPSRGMPFFGDSLEYVVTALHFAQWGDLDSTGRPPAYPFALGASYWVGDQLRAALDLGGTRGDVPRAIQALWSTLTALLVFLLGRDMFGARAGLAAATIVAFYPNFVGFTTLFWTETLFTLFLVAWLLALRRGVTEKRPGMLCWAGLFLGMGAVTRQFGLLLVVAAVGWTACAYGGSLRRRAGAAALVLLFAAVAVAPVTIRNYFAHGGFVLVSTTSGRAALWGSGVAPLGQGVGLNLPRQRSAAYEADAAAARRAREIIRADPWTWLKRVVWVNAPGLWNPGHDGVVQYLSVGAYAGLTTSRARALMALIFATYSLVMIAGLTGMALAPRWRDASLYWLILAVYCLAHALPGGLPRHRLPFMACAAVFAGFVVSRSTAELRSLLRPRRVTLAVAALALFAWAATRPSLHYTRTAWREAGLIDVRANAGTGDGDALLPGDAPR